MAIKNEKFDGFLKRVLDKKSYFDVKSYDECIVVSKSESHTFRFVFLTNTSLCFTDNPPKCIVLSIPLAELVSVQQVHDVANFIQKDLQDIAQHFLVKVLRKNSTTKSVEAIEKQDIPPESKSLFLKLVANKFNKKMQQNGLNISSHIANEQPVTSQNNSNNNNNQINSSNLSTWQSYSDKRNGSILSGSTVPQSTSPRSHSNSRDLKGKDILEPFVKRSLPHDTDDLHIYVLSQETIFLPMLKTVWREYLLGETYAREEKESHAVTSSYFFTLFADLKDDLLAGFTQKAPVEVVFGYFHELKTVLKQHIELKTQFWNDNELFSVCVDFLVRLLSSNTKPFPGKKLDEIECAILINQTLSLALQQTESLKACRNVLQQPSSNFYTKFIETLIKNPFEKDINSLDNEEKLLCFEYYESVVDVLYQLIIISEQIPWSHGRFSKPTFTAFLIYSTIDSSSQLEAFLENLVSLCVKLWSSSDKSALDCKTCIQVYRVFVVLHRVVSNCKKAKEQVNSLHYKEEFKYYICPENVEIKVPEAHPASGLIWRVVHSTISLMTGEKYSTTFM